MKFPSRGEVRCSGIEGSKDPVLVVLFKPTANNYSNITLNDYNTMLTIKCLAGMIALMGPFPCNCFKYYSTEFGPAWLVMKN